MIPQNLTVFSFMKLVLAAYIPTLKTNIKSKIYN